MKEFKNAWKIDDSEWIKQREENWLVFYKYYINEISNSDDIHDPNVLMERIKQYYMTGELIHYEWGELCVLDLLWMHPEITVESARHIFNWYREKSSDLSSFIGFMNSIQFIKAGVLDKHVILIYTKGLYGDSFEEYCLLKQVEPHENAWFFIEQYLSWVEDWVYYNGLKRFNPLAPFEFLIPHFIEALSFINMDNIRTQRSVKRKKSSFISLFARSNYFIPRPKRDWPDNPVQHFVKLFNQQLLAANLPPPFDQYYEQRTANKKYRSVSESNPKALDKQLYSGNEFSSCYSTIKTIPLIVNHYHQLGFGKTGFDSKNISVIKTAEVFSPVSMQDKKLPDIAYVYRINIEQKEIMNPEHQLAYDLFFFEEIESTVFFRLVYIQGHLFNFKQCSESSVGMSYHLWLYRLTLSGVTNKEYFFESDNIAPSQKNAKSKPWLFLHPATESYDMHSLEQNLEDEKLRKYISEFEQYKDFGTVVPETPKPDYMYDDYKKTIATPLEYDEIYQTISFEGGRSDFRLVCSSPCLADVIEKVQSWLLKEQWVQLTDKPVTQQEAPDFIIDKDYLSRMKPVENARSEIDPFAAVGLYCDEDTDEMTEAEQQQAIGEQNIQYQTLTSTPKFTHSELFIANIHIAQPIRDTAKYAYCDKDFYDDPELWGEEADIDDINPAIRRGDYGLIMYFQFNEGRKIKTDSTLAKHIRQLIQYANQELGIELKYNLLSEYALSLDEWELKENDMLDFTELPKKSLLGRVKTIFKKD